MALRECDIGFRNILSIEQDPQRGTVTIDGTVYSRELLNGGLVTAAEGRWFRIVERRESGEVILRQQIVPRWVSWFFERFAGVS